MNELPSPYPLDTKMPQTRFYPLRRSVVAMNAKLPQNRSTISLSSKMRCYGISVWVTSTTVPLVSYTSMLMASPRTFHEEIHFIRALFAKDRNCIRHHEDLLSTQNLPNVGKISRLIWVSSFRPHRVRRTRKQVTTPSLPETGDPRNHVAKPPNGHATQTRNYDRLLVARDDKSSSKKR